MRYGIIADIHGNLEALETVIAACRQEGIQDFLCLGDLVGYGANPKECLKMIQYLKAICIAGNHDWAVLGKIDVAYFNPVAKAAIAWTRQQLSQQDLNFLKSLDLIFKNDDMILVHGTLDHPEEFHYLLDMSDILNTFSLIDRPLCFLAHTHVPGIFVKHKEKFYDARNLKITLSPQEQCVVNVGSVGQPRDGSPLAAYCIYDTDARKVEIKRIAYDIETAQKKILVAGLPAFLAQRLSIGR